MRLIMGKGYTYNTEGRCELHKHVDPVPVIEWREPGDESPEFVSYCRFCSLNVARTLWPLKDVNHVMAKWNAAVVLERSAKTIGQLANELRSELLGGVA